MTIYLKQSTASQEVPLGYFVDSADGNTEETGLTIANTDIKLWKNGATTLANKNSGGATHISNGVYYAVLDATDTNTLGPLVIFVHVSGALAVRLECLVLPANVYDSWIAGSDYLQVDVTAISEDTTAANNLESDYDGTGYAKTNSTIGTATTVTNGVTASTVSDKTGYSLSAAGIQAIWDALTSALTTVGSVGKLIVDNLNAAITSRSSHSAADVWSVATREITGGTVDTCTTNTDMRGTDNALLAASAPTNFGDLAITASTGKVTVGTNDDKTGYSISGTKTTLDDLNDITAAAVGDVQIADSIPADGALPTIEQALYMIVQYLNERSVSGTTVTVKKVDGSTSLYTLTLDDATSPTSITRAT